MALDASHKLALETKAAESIKVDIAALTDDLEAIRDTLEGETNLKPLVRIVLASIEDDQAMVDGCAARIEDLTARKSRFEKRINTKRALIERAMVIADMPSIETDIATATLSARPRQIDITDEAAIPAEFWKAKEPALDKKALAAALKDGREVPGATLDNGGLGLTVRRK